MAFYDEFAVCYDKIFPADPDTVKFLGSVFGPPGGKLADLACGTGGYALALAETGFEVTGIDLSESMIELAFEKAAGRSGLRFFAQDMAKPEIGSDFRGWYCIGNSLVHLAGPAAILKALTRWRQLLAPGGRWVIQILNYDRILAGQIGTLPTITAPDGSELTRAYEFSSKQEVIFKTQLRCNGQIFTNAVPLYPLERAELRSLCEEAGLEIEDEFGEFDATPWTPASFAYVATGTL